MEKSGTAPTAIPKAGPLPTPGIKRGVCNHRRNAISHINRQVNQQIQIVPPDVLGGGVLLVDTDAGPEACQALVHGFCQDCMVAYRQFVSTCHWHECRFLECCFFLTDSNLEFSNCRTRRSRCALSCIVGSIISGTKVLHGSNELYENLPTSSQRYFLLTGTFSTL